MADKTKPISYKTIVKNKTLKDFFSVFKKKDAEKERDEEEV